MRAFHDEYEGRGRSDAPGGMNPMETERLRREPSRRFGPGGDGFRTLPGGPRGDSPRDGEGPRTLPGMPGGFGGGFHTLPAGPRGGGPRMPGRPGFPPPGRPPFGGMPPHGGRVPHRPGPEFPQERIDGADLTELIDMVSRAMRHRPEVGQARGQNLILSILAGREVLSQRELQQLLGIQPGSLSELVSKLEGKGLLTREKAEDRRGNLLRITDAGRRALPSGGSAPDEALFGALTPGERDQLAGLLRRVLTDWSARRPEWPQPNPGEGRFVPLAESDKPDGMKQV